MFYEVYSSPIIIHPMAVTMEQPSTGTSGEVKELWAIKHHFFSRRIPTQRSCIEWHGISTRMGGGLQCRLQASLPCPTSQLHSHESPFAISPRESHPSGTSPLTWVSTPRTRQYVPPRRNSVVYSLIDPIYRRLPRPYTPGLSARQTPPRKRATPTVAYSVQCVATPPPFYGEGVATPDRKQSARNRGQWRWLFSVVLCMDARRML